MNHAKFAGRGCSSWPRSSHWEHPWLQTPSLPPLIPRDVLFGNPERISPQISPDGTRLAWIAPDKKNVLQVWVKTIGKDDDKVVTADPKRGIRQYFWAENSKMLIYLQDSDGDENFHLFGVDLASGNVRDLTPFQGVKAQVTAVDPNFPDTILVSLNARNRAPVRRLPARPEHRGPGAGHRESRRRHRLGGRSTACKSAPPRRARPMAAWSSASATSRRPRSVPGSRPARRIP